MPWLFLLIDKKYESIITEQICHFYRVLKEIMLNKDFVNMIKTVNSNVKKRFCRDLIFYLQKRLL